jgi:CheY-like chemotaxis protein
MEQAVDRASPVTKKLLAFSRRQSVQPVVLDVNAIVRDLLPIFRQLLTDGVEVAVELAPDLVPVKADAGQLEQVIINLATNARDAMPHGGRLHVVTANEALGAHSPVGLAPGTYASLAITDSGVGMDPATQARIFDPFFSTKPKDRGMGLGLAMVHGIVSAAGGHIAVRSAPGEGATFTILLPGSEDEIVTHKAPEVSPPPARRAVTVLIVDDEPAVRTVARRFLETNGYAVMEADGGERAVALLEDRQVQIDVVLTDMVMPGISGRDVIARARAARPQTPVVLMTGFAGEERATEAGEIVSAVVTKPFSASVLVRTVASAHDAALERSSSRG